MLSVNKSESERVSFVFYMFATNQTYLFQFVILILYFILVFMIFFTFYLKSMEKCTLSYLCNLNKLQVK